jgi:hypothetical protein
MEVFHPPEGELITGIDGIPLLRLWPTVLWFPGAVRRIPLIGANEDLSQPRSFNTRKIEASQERGLDLLVIEALRKDLPFYFIETSHPGGPIMLRRGESPEQVRIDAKSSAFIRYLTLEVLYN